MSAEDRTDLTAMLADIRAGVSDARDRLLRAAYGELLRTARRLMRHERRDHTLDAGALVHEAVLRLIGGNALAGFSDRCQLYAAASQAMRQVLVDHARGRNAAKRQGQ